MKRCLTCARVYDDHSLRFCLDDGTNLVDMSAGAGVEPATAVLPANGRNPAPTIKAPLPAVGPVHQEMPSTIASAVPNERSALRWIVGGGTAFLSVSGLIIVAWLALGPKQPLRWHLVMEVDPNTANREAATVQTIAVIRSRLNAAGVSHFEVMRQDTGIIAVNLPDVNDPERLKKIISAPSVEHLAAGVLPAPVKFIEERVDK